MKTQILTGLAVAALGTCVAYLVHQIDPEMTLRTFVHVSVGIWAGIAGLLVVLGLIRKDK